MNRGTEANQRADPPAPSFRGRSSDAAALADAAPDRNPARHSPPLAALFPSQTSAAELRAPGEQSLLYPEESCYLGTATAKRRGEFAAGRLCARRALADLGAVETPLKVQTDRQALWPTGFTGSITHTAGFCGAVVARRQDIHALGLDAELVGQVTRDVWSEILTLQEGLWISTLPLLRQDKAAALIFSAKEAFFKCQFAITGEWLEFQAVAVGFPVRVAEVGTFVIHPQVKLALLGYVATPLVGRFRFVEDLVLTGMALPARANEPSCGTKRSQPSPGALRRPCTR